MRAAATAKARDTRMIRTDIKAHFKWAAGGFKKSQEPQLKPGRDDFYPKPGVTQMCGIADFMQAVSA